MEKKKINDNSIMLIVAIVVGVLLLSGIFGFGGMMRGYSMMGNYGGFLGPIIMILFAIALVLFIIWLIKQIQK